ncbi:MAG: hypothetical protein AAFS10_19700 [Myxococcota bacterium]
MSQCGSSDHDVNDHNDDGPPKTDEAAPGSVEVWGTCLNESEPTSVLAYERAQLRSGARVGADRGQVRLLGDGSTLQPNLGRHAVAEL